MDRRTFVRNGAVAMAGALLGLGWFGRARGAERESPPPSPPAAGPRMALIIDDIGYSRSRARDFAGLGVPLTFAVLPRLPRSRELAEWLHQAGQEILLHQPMEPFNSRLNPGPGTLFVGAEPGSIADVIAENLDGIPNAAGVNNHMGSRFTASALDMHTALAAVKTSGLFFVDSLTSDRSVALDMARQLAVTATCRNVFLDNRRSAQAVYAQLVKLWSHAARTGAGVGIGHPFPETVRGLRRFLDDPRHADIRLVHVSALLG